MKMQLPRVSHAYQRGSDAGLELAAEAVYAHLYYHPEFPSPPVNEAALDRAIGVFAIARAAALYGDPAALNEKIRRREELLALLEQLASYVESRSGNDRATLISSGFSLRSAKRPASQLPKPEATRFDKRLAAKSTRPRETARTR